MVPNAELKIRLLGEPRAWRGEVPLKLGHGLPTAVFVALALRANRVVSRDELVAALWDDDCPNGASNRIYTYVSALRRLVERGVGTREAAGVLESGYSGYRLVVSPDNLDVALVQRYRDQARAMRASGDARGELSAVDSALALWQGEALQGVPGPLALSWRQRLTEVRLGLSARRACLMIDMGYHDEVIDELRELVSHHPAREDLHHSLMLALSRSGRQVEALGVYRQAREALLEHFGAEPGAALRELRQAVLRSGSPVVPGIVGGAVVAERELSGRAYARIASARPATFVGRDGELARVRAAVAGVRTGRGGALWVNGAPGTGKTALLGAGLAELVGAECVVGWGVADELSHRVPLGVLESCVGGLDSGLLRRAGLTGLDLVPESVAKRADARVRLGGVLARVRSVLDAAGSRPVVLVIDDLHWADDETLLVWRQLHELTAHHPLLLISTCRPLPRHRNLDLLRMLVAESGCDTLELGELSDAEVRELLHRSHPAGRHTTDLVATLSGGNPAFVRAIGQAMASRPSRGWLATPDSVARAVHDYLDCFSSATREMLRCASLLGDPHTVGDVLRVSGKRAHQLVDSVAEALAGGALVDLGGSRLRFRHPIVKRVLHESVPVAARRAALADLGVDNGLPATYWAHPVGTRAPVHDDLGVRLDAIS